MNERKQRELGTLIAKIRKHRTPILIGIGHTDPRPALPDEMTDDAIDRDRSDATTRAVAHQAQTHPDTGKTGYALNLWEDFNR